MKKLLFLLILSFFSAQSFAAGCPDGSEPVKSVSADGTYFVYNCGNSDTSSQTKNLATSSSTQIEWVDGLYAKSIKDEFNVFSKDFSKPGDSGSSMIIPLGSGDFSGDGVPEVFYAISYHELKRGSQIKPIFLTTTPGSGFSLFKPIMDVVPYVDQPRDFIINQDGIIAYANNEIDTEWMLSVINDLLISDSGIVGDINQDGLVNILDIVSILNYILGVYIPTDNQFNLSDVNQDGLLNVLDVVLLVNIILN